MIERGAHGDEPFAVQAGLELADQLVEVSGGPGVQVGQADQQLPGVPIGTEWVPEQTAGRPVSNAKRVGVHCDSGQ
jgi:hypothetical protein